MIASDGERLTRTGRLGLSAAVALILALAPEGARAQSQDKPRLYTNEAFVEDALRPPSLALKDPMSVFAYVLGSLPARVTVYPTENYYYFQFVHGGTRYAGNIRLDASDRDAGKLHFAYYEDLAEWKAEQGVTHVVLDRAVGVAVEKLDRLLYRVAYGATAVEFALNDLSKVVPPPHAIGVDETFVGPVFDESAIRFFLVYNRALKLFHYVLDETVKVADDFNVASGSDRILIGKRTGFAFYRDHRLNRKILVGVFEGNSRVNNYYDGPFDQLPDNFIEGEALRSIILEVEPSLAGKIDRFGGSPDGSDRFLISPYLHYRTDQDLLVFHRCATNKNVTADRYYACFVIEPDASDVAAKLTMQKKRIAKAKRPAKARPAAGR
jgi:hypothetical protein